MSIFVDSNLWNNYKQFNSEINYCYFLYLFIYLFLNFGGHESFLWGHWYPYFGLLMTSPLGFKARVGSAIFELSGGVCVTLHVPWDSPLVWHLPTSCRYYAAAHTVRSGRPDTLPTEQSWVIIIIIIINIIIILYTCKIGKYTLINTAS